MEFLPLYTGSRKTLESTHACVKILEIVASLPICCEPVVLTLLVRSYQHVFNNLLTAPRCNNTVIIMTVSVLLEELCIKSDSPIKIITNSQQLTVFQICSINFGETHAFFT